MQLPSTCISPNSHVQRTNALLKKVEFVIVPVVNPDGYVVSCVNLRQSSCMFASVGGQFQMHSNYNITLFTDTINWNDHLIIHILQIWIFLNSKYWTLKIYKRNKFELEFLKANFSNSLKLLNLIATNNYPWKVHICARVLLCTTCRKAGVEKNIGYGARTWASIQDRETSIREWTWTEIFPMHGH